MSNKGDQTAGLFSNNDALANSLIASSKKVSESLWRMPILEEHRESVKGEFADITNSPKSRYGGACTAAAFLVKNNICNNLYEFLKFYRKNLWKKMLNGFIWT